MDIDLSKQVHDNIRQVKHDLANDMQVVIGEIQKAMDERDGRINATVNKNIDVDVV
jgi:hypothetical protein